MNCLVVGFKAAMLPPIVVGAGMREVSNGFRAARAGFAVITAVTADHIFATFVVGIQLERVGSNCEI
jgi:hypothetical protein